jgi:hypothetical protein
MAAEAVRKRIFLLSPARVDGKRAALVMNQAAQFELARRLRGPAGVALGEVFAFMSGLYFRGKLSYAEHFAQRTSGIHGSYVITSNAGLRPSSMPVVVSHIREFASVPIDPEEPRYAVPLRTSAAKLLNLLPADYDVVLLGSIASAKYFEILVECFGERLLFPEEFIGRGDMSRGGLLLRAVRSNTELQYLRAVHALSRTGKRPPKLERIGRGTVSGSGKTRGQSK